LLNVRSRIADSYKISRSLRARMAGWWRLWFES
jgi:hypothetical protein